MKYCPRCGNHIHETQRFCNQCGNDLEAFEQYRNQMITNSKRKMVFYCNCHFSYCNDCRSMFDVLLLFVRPVDAPKKDTPVHQVSKKIVKKVKFQMILIRKGKKR